MEGIVIEQTLHEKRIFRAHQEELSIDQKRMMEWPSDRVAPGGVFHFRKTTYSKDTQDLLKVLMDEAKLTILQRNQINYHLRNGEPLPQLEHEEQKRPKTSIPRKYSTEFVRKRSLDFIRESGAYNLEKNIPHGPYKEPTEKAKIKLQDSMMGIKRKEISNSKIKNPNQTPKNENMDLISELLNEIKERNEWLEEMEKLGEGKKYRSIIKNQIAEKLREIKRLEKSTMC